MKQTISIEDFKEKIEGFADMTAEFRSPSLTTESRVVSPVTVSSLSVEKITVDLAFPAHIVLKSAAFTIRIGQISEIRQTTPHSFVIMCGLLPQNSSRVVLRQRAQ